MGGYVYGLILVGVSAAVVELLAVGGEGRMKAHLRLVTGLCILIACLQPVKEGIVYLKDLAEDEIPLNVSHPSVDKEQYHEMFDGYLIEMGEQEVRRWVRDVLTDVFGVSEENSRVEVSMGVVDGVLGVTEVNISLSGKAVLKNPHQIEEYIYSRLLCPCHVSVAV